MVIRSLSASKRPELLVEKVRNPRPVLHLPRENRVPTAIHFRVHHGAIKSSIAIDVNNKYVSWIKYGVRKFGKSLCGKLEYLGHASAQWNGNTMYIRVLSARVLGGDFSSNLSLLGSHIIEGRSYSLDNGGMRPACSFEGRRKVHHSRATDFNQDICPVLWHSQAAMP